MSHSGELWDRARTLMPAGVSSPVRMFAPHPVFFEGGEGAWLRDVDGKRYLDLNLAFGPMILGHAPPAVVQAVQAQAAMGSLLGAPSPLEPELAALIARHVPSLSLIHI